MNVAVVGAGSCLLLDRSHEVTLVCHDPEQSRAIAETGHNPSYLTHVDLSGVVPNPGRRT